MYNGIFSMVYMNMVINEKYYRTIVLPSESITLPYNHSILFVRVIIVCNNNNSVNYIYHGKLMNAVFIDVLCVSGGTMSVQGQDISEYHLSGEQSSFIRL